MTYYYGIAIALIGTALVIGQIISAYRDSFLTVRQMKSRGFPEGIPLLYHGGIWGDAFVLTPLLAYIAMEYGKSWNDIVVISIATIFSLTVTIFMVHLWVNNSRSGLPEAHACKGKLTTAGLLHAIYMAVAVLIIMLFFSYLSNAPFWTIIAVTAILGFHVIYGTHIVLGWCKPKWYPERPHQQSFVWIVVGGSWATLALVCFIKLKVS